MRLLATLRKCPGKPTHLPTVAQYGGGAASFYDARRAKARSGFQFTIHDAELVSHVTGVKGPVDVDILQSVTRMEGFGQVWP